MSISMEELIGKAETHLVRLEKTSHSIHVDAKEDFLSLKASAADAGFDLALASSFRDYMQQKKIWDNKASGKRVLLDDQGSLLKYSSLTEKEIMYAILRWSALPGASRHHWGTDLDVYDANSLPSENYRVELIPKEVADDGMFGPFHLWLDKQIESGNSFNFFRPYAKDLGGVSPERWHISYRPIAEEYLRALNFDVFIDMLVNSDIELKNIILENAESIYENYVINISS